MHYKVETSRRDVSTIMSGNNENYTWFCQPSLRPHPLTPSPVYTLLQGEGGLSFSLSFQKRVGVRFYYDIKGKH